MPHTMPLKWINLMMLLFMIILIITSTMFFNKLKFNHLKYTTNSTKKKFHSWKW
uniref:ATP synthase F0 subunit 8 n=1 Tax=Aposthonia japonica TaxID=911381 RepID=H7CD18_9NEOP|nr:ATP synthase F0 subunit 8 [Aposthonia japonica]